MSFFFPERNHLPLIQLLTTMTLAVLSPAAALSESPAFLLNDAERMSQVTTSLKVPDGCLTEVFFERLEIAGKALHLGVYREQRAIPGSRDGEETTLWPVLESEQVFLFEDPPPPLEGSSCQWPAPAGENIDRATTLCLNREDKCKPSPALRRSQEDQRLVPVLSVVERRTLTNKDVRMSLYDLSDPRACDLEGSLEWVHYLYDLENRTNTDLNVLASPSDATACTGQVMVPVAGDIEEGLSWIYHPLTDVETYPGSLLVPEPECSNTGSGELNITLKNPHFSVSAIRTPTAAVEIQFHDRTPWLFDSNEEPWSEVRVAGNIHHHANSTIRGYGEIFTWLPRFIREVVIRQIIPTDGKNCKAWWRTGGLIELPFLCRQWDEFLPKGLCPDVVAHELSHELFSRLLDHTTGGRVKKLPSKFVWEGLADFLSVSLAGEDGIFGTQCGTDFRSVRDGLYRPSLTRSVSLLEPDVNGSRKSLIFSGALWDVADLLVAERVIQRLPEARRAVEQMVVVTVMQGGHDLRSFAEKFVDLARIVLGPAAVAPVCRAFWDEHHIFAKQCLANKTRTAIFDFRAIPVNGRLEVRGSFSGTAACPKYELRAEDTVPFEQDVTLTRTKGPWQRRDELMGWRLMAKGPRTKKVTLHTKCREETQLARSVAVQLRPAKRDPVNDSVAEVKILRTPNNNRWIVSRSTYGRLEFRAALPNLDLLAWNPEPNPIFTQQPLDVYKNGEIWVPWNGEQKIFDLTNEKVRIEKESQLPPSNFRLGFDPRMTGKINGQELEIFEPGAEGGRRASPWKTPIDPKTIRVETCGENWALLAKRPGVNQFVRRHYVSNSQYIGPGVIELSDPPGLVFEAAQGGDELLTFPESSCRKRPFWQQDGEATAAMTCDGELRFRDQPTSPWQHRSLPPLVPWIECPLHLADVDGDKSLELVVGPITVPGFDTVFEFQAFEMNGEPVAGQWPIRTHQKPTVSAALDDLDGDGCAEVVVGASEIQIWDTNDGLPNCRRPDG